MRTTIAAVSFALIAVAGATAASAQPAPYQRTQSQAYVPYQGGSGYYQPGYQNYNTHQFPYATSPSAYYDFYNQYPEWAQKAFTPGFRR